MSTPGTEIVGLPSRAPDDVSQRILGQTYMLKNEKIRLWTQNGWKCIHGKQPSECSVGCKLSRVYLDDDKYKHLQCQWDAANLRPFSSYTHGSGALVNWICDQGHKFPMRITDRTRIGSEQGCPDCAHAKRRVHDPEEKRLKQQQVLPVNNISVGEASEKWVAQQLRLCDPRWNVEEIGQTTDKTDTKITLETGEVKSIQVKTMTQITSDRLSCCVKQRYAPRMLLVMVNRNRNRFAVAYAEDIDVDCPTFSSTKRVHLQCWDQPTFLTRIRSLLPGAADYVQDVSVAASKELGMNQRLTQVCLQRGISVVRNGSNGNTIDGWVGDIPVQCKYRSFGQTSRKGVCTVGAVKGSGMLNRRLIQRPYHEDDPWKILIVELGGTIEEPTLYHGRFCMIPKEVLIAQGVLETRDCLGKTSFSVCPPNYERNHWSKPYWDNFTPFPRADSNRVATGVSTEPETPSIDATEINAQRKRKSDDEDLEVESEARAGKKCRMGP
jgi:hypothetical protein